MKAYELFENRKLYKESVLPNEPNMPYVVDFWYKNKFYGKKNSENDFVYLSETNLKALTTDDGKTLFAVDFVVDAFNDLLEAHTMAILKNKIDKTGLYGKIAPESAWQSVLQKHHSYMNNMYEFILSILLANPIRTQKIIRFQDFMDFIMPIFKYLDKVFITRTAFVASGFFSPYNTGLIIDIKKNDHSSDNEKVTFLDDSDFNYFLGLARRFGFSINKNAPWSLVANIFTNEMKNYMKKYGLTGNAEELFDFYYYRTYLQDLEVFKAYMIEFYNSFVRAYPIASTDNNIIARRQPFNPAGFIGANNNDDTLYWLQKYLKLRIIEQKIDWTEQTIRNETKRALQLYLSLDLSTSLGYINDITKV